MAPNPQTPAASDEAVKAAEAQVAEAAKQLEAATAAIAERDARIAELESAKPSKPSAAKKASTADYTVVGVGLNYKKPGEAGPITLGLQGRVIALEADEAARLLDLGSIREATEQDLAREAVSAAREDANRRSSEPPSANPYGGTPRVAPTEHARQVYTQLETDQLQAEVDRRALAPVGTSPDGSASRDDLIQALVDNDSGAEPVPAETPAA